MNTDSNPGMNQGIRTNLSPLTGLAMFVCIFVVMFIVVSLISTLLVGKMQSNPTGAMRIATLLQDIFAFIVPAVVTSLMMTRLAARFLWVDTALPLWPCLVAVATLFAAMPVMDIIIHWNDTIEFPDSMKNIEQSLRSSENAASDYVRGLFGNGSVGSLIVAICIVGVMAALSEELFFRGCMLRLFTLCWRNHHLAIWITAIVFSALHLQFFGFVPRMLLGAYFGYLVWWSKCLWIPIIVHAVNNTSAIYGQWLFLKNNSVSLTESLDATPGVWLVVVSLLLTVCGIYLFRKNTYTQ